MPAPQDKEPVWLRNARCQLAPRERLSLVRAAVVCRAVLHTECKHCGILLKQDSEFLSEFEWGREALEPDLRGAVAGRLAAARALRLASAAGQERLQEMVRDVEALEGLVHGASTKPPIPVTEHSAIFWRGISSVTSALEKNREQVDYFAATTFNPEAGDHPIPQGREELRAIMAASRHALSECPPLARFGKRGYDFVLSDGLWLASLCESLAEPSPWALTDSEARWQLQWLAELLGRFKIPLAWLARFLALARQEWEERSLPLVAQWVRLEGLIAPQK